MEQQINSKLTKEMEENCNRDFAAAAAAITAETTSKKKDLRNGKKFHDHEVTVS